MRYRINPRNGDELSVLSFGCMRFAKDEAEVEREIIYAIERGINYFDTAYIYPKSEATLGRILAQGYRDRVKIASKLPPYLVKRTEDFEKIFQKQLSRLQTDRIDYYLIHMLPDVKEWNRLVKLGICEWLAEKRAAGQIINLGFSYHGGLPVFKKLIDVGDWEFCLLQFNYLDENNQAGREGLLYASERNIPVMVMEPLRGGKLVRDLPPAALKVWEQAEPQRSAAEWALRWVWHHPQVLTVLSGMNSQAMLEENIRMANEATAGVLTAEELALYEEVKGIIRSTIRVPCTGCNYCMPCPQGVDIPLCFNCYNETALDHKMKARFYYIFRANHHEASRCKQCGKCEKHCPQQIAISAELANATRQLESFPYRPMRSIIKKFMHLS